MTRYFLSICFLFTFAFGISSCNSGSPKKTAEKFLTSINQFEYTAAKTVSTEDTKKMVDMYEQLTQNLDDSAKMKFKQVKFDIKSVKEEKDNAVVTYTTSNYPKEQSLHLVKQKGQWLVQWTKEDAVNEKNDQPEPGADSTGGAQINTAAPDTAKTK